MATLELILILMLQFEGISGDILRLYHRVGDHVVLPCNSPSSSYSCAIVKWIYDRDSYTQTEVEKGVVSQSSPRAARLSLDTKCSLIITNITPEDYGEYGCRPGEAHSVEGRVYLDILNISPPDSGPTKDGDVTLKCSLMRRTGYRCPENSLRWVDETGAELLDEDDGYKFEGRSNCDSSLTVKHQRSRNRRFSCQFVEENSVKIEVHYTSVSEDPIHNNIIIIIIAVIGVVLLVVAAVVLIKRRRRTRNTEDVQHPNHHYDEIQCNVTYATVGPFSSEASRNIKVKEKEDSVTYSTVRTNMKTEADINPSSIYSLLTKPK
ncbi:uncharacterized protein LOC119617967 isoform X2 [Kryptolebias marmoratus]|uniref:uncharacterized protein LOC119617967 isoform X2 n=1 Tax=Kryptolebias marmoratus TaxID=37003 RepID=UPI0018ACDF1E|nr:uncharacterized protein LOC119617967 isoform X2 [Kryptolebias marmoratus]